MGITSCDTTREVMKSLVGQQSTFLGKFSTYGNKQGGKNRRLPTICLEEIIDEKGNPVTDHSWLSLTREIRALALGPGDCVEFVAKVTEYTKGYKGKSYTSWKRKLSNVTTDYGFTHPVSVRKITEEEWAHRCDARQGLVNAQDPEPDERNKHLRKEQ
jgi:hypothetical protein